MRMNLFGVFRHLLAPVFALLLAVTLLLSFGGVTHAATVTASRAAPTANCITAAPPSQEVPVDQPAKVAVTVYCSYPYLFATWGDGTSSQYPLCLEVCRVPPFTVEVTHTYMERGDFHPELCLGPSPVEPPAVCTSVEIIVL